MTKTLRDKLGFKPDSRGLVIACPAAVDELSDVATNASGPVDMIIAFVTNSADVPARLAEALTHYQRGARLWFAYPKQTGSIASDISRDRGWESLTALDLLPVTQISIDETWSALRFRYRDEIAKLTRKS